MDKSEKHKVTDLSRSLVSEFRGLSDEERRVGFALLPLTQPDTSSPLTISSMTPGPRGQAQGPP